MRAGGATAGAAGMLPVTRVADTSEVTAAREALEKAQLLVGVDLPSLDKGPEADCLLCHVPRGAFLRAERGSGLGWCHVLCAFSKGLVIEDRVVKVGPRCGAVRCGAVIPVFDVFGVYDAPLSRWL